MTIDEAVSKLQFEKQNNLPSRFPCRAVFVKNLDQYCQLLTALKKISNIRVVKSDEIFIGSDVLPQYTVFDSETYGEEWVILTGISEYLQLFLQDSPQEKIFLTDIWNIKYKSNSRGRIIIPVWGYSIERFKELVDLNESRQLDFCFDCVDDSLPEQEMDICVYADIFKNYKSALTRDNAISFCGLREFFEYFESPSPSNTNFIIFTKRYRKFLNKSGNINTRVVTDLLAYIQKNMPGGNNLTAENCSESMRQNLMNYVLNGYSLDNAILKILNVSSFSGIDVMGKWKSMTDDIRSFIALWFQLHPDVSYLNHCFKVSLSIDEIDFTVLHEIFNFYKEKPEWVTEFRKLVTVMDINLDARFFSALDAIGSYEERLPFLTDNTKEERVYLIKITGKCITEGKADIIEKIKYIYLALGAYLSDCNGINHNETDAYILRYKTHKLANTLPDDEEVHFSGVDVESFDKRYSVLHNHEGNDTIFLWVDALGIEWLSLLYWSLKSNCDADISNVSVVQANLPTETDYNNQWKDMTGCNCEKLDKLDKLAHNGVVDNPDYYTCVEEQIEFVSSDIYKRVTKLLETYRRVVITGDHGTSRLAARFFHNRDGIAVPKNAAICSFGRYCKLQVDNMPLGVHIKFCETSAGKFAVFSNYDHFKQSGNAAGGNGDNIIYGEVHGGATPEEMLVPVLVVESGAPVVLSGSWEQESVRIFRKKATLTIEFNKNVQNVRAEISGFDGLVTSTDNGKKWTLEFSGLKAGKYHVEVYADGCIVNMPDITIRSALGGGDGDLP